MRRLSPATVRAYRSDLRDLGDSIGGRDLADIDLEALRDWLWRATQRGDARSTLARRAAAARSFFSWAQDEGLIEHDPSLRLVAPKRGRTLPTIASRESLTALLDARRAAAAGGDPIALRDHAILELLYGAGIRVSELCGLDLDDLDLDRGTARVLGKGSKQRMVPVGSHARNALAAWRSESAAKADAPVFPGRGGKAISPRAVQLRLRQLARKQGLFKRVHPHLLRHTFASHVLESSGDLRGVQELLGHADLGTTQIYTHLDFQHLAKVYDAAHPRARRKKPA